MKIIAVWILNLLVPRPATDGETETVGQHIGSWTFMNGERPIGTTNCQESSNILGLCPPTPGGAGRRGMLKKKITLCWPTPYLRRGVGGGG